MRDREDDCQQVEQDEMASSGSFDYMIKWLSSSGAPSEYILLLEPWIPCCIQVLQTNSIHDQQNGSWIFRSPKRIT